MPKIDLQNLQKIEDDRFSEALAKVLRRHRKARGITRDGLAFQLGLHKNTLYGVEVGIKRKSGHFSHTQLTMANFIRLAAFFGYQPGEFLQEVLIEASDCYPSKKAPHQNGSKLRIIGNHT